MARLAFLVNGDFDSTAGVRARAFARRVGSRFDLTFAYRGERKVWEIRKFLRFLHYVKPEITYVMDLGYSGVVAAALYKAACRNRVVLDTGDSIYELAKAMGERGVVALQLTHGLEELGLTAADVMIVRSRYHAQLLRERGMRAEVVQDGVDVDAFEPGSTAGMHLPTDGRPLTIGVLGSIKWNPRFGTCYGAELVELIRSLEDKPVRGLIIGDGSGLPYLQRRCSEYGIGDRVRFLGRVPYEELPRRLTEAQVWLSTQTNDRAGNVRTTGKLPLYLASGRFVFATRVGEAAHVLPDEMLVDFRGSHDPEYPLRLAERVLRLIEHPHALDAARCSVRLAREHFEYDRLARRVTRIIESELTEARRRNDRSEKRL